MKNKKQLFLNHTKLFACSYAPCFSLVIPVAQVFFFVTNLISTFQRVKEFLPFFASRVLHLVLFTVMQSQKKIFLLLFCFLRQKENRLLIINCEFSFISESYYINLFVLSCYIAFENVFTLLCGICISLKNFKICIF